MKMMSTERDSNGVKRTVSPEDRFSDLVMAVAIFEKRQQVLVVIPQAARRRRCVFRSCGGRRVDLVHIEVW